MSKKLLWGSDPEAFAVYNNGGAVSVMPPVIFRTELNVPVRENGRHPIFAQYGDTIIHEDGAAFELSTPPSHDWREMWRTMKEAREQFEKDVLSLYPEYCTGKLESIPSAVWDVERWSDGGEEFIWATRFGCDPDNDVFDTKACRVLNAAKHPRRYAGGHIHASGLDEIRDTPLVAIKCMVMTAGLASIGYSPRPDLEKERLFLYGKPGKFRVQKYGDGTVGIEYRTPSAMWAGDESLAEKVFEWAGIGLNYLLAGGLIRELEGDFLDQAAKAITGVDQKAALFLLSEIARRV